MIKSSELVGLLGLLDYVLLSSSPDKRLWSLDPFGLFTCKSYFQFLTHSLTPTSFLLDKPIWKSKAPSKVKSFNWTVMLNRINTNDMLQVQRPHKAISLDVCVMGRIHNQYLTHFCTIMWLTLFGIFGECQVCPVTLDQLLLTSFVGFGKNKEAKSLWQCSIVGM